MNNPNPLSIANLSEENLQFIERLASNPPVSVRDDIDLRLIDEIRRLRAENERLSNELGRVQTEMRNVSYPIGRCVPIIGGDEL